MKRRHAEHGGAMMVTLIVIAVLLAGAGMLVSIEVNSTRATGMTRSGVTGTFCAEAGLAAARTTIANNYAQWAGNFCTNPDHSLCVEPAWISGAFSHDLDLDGDTDFKILIVDNDDELPLPDPSIDIDRRIYIVSLCTTFPENQRELAELVDIAGGVACYGAQAGGGTGYGNTCN